MHSTADGAFKHLIPGREYVVIQLFTDYDHRVHPIGERWVFLRAGFVPYYDGLTLNVQPEIGPERAIRLEWTDSGQGALIDALEQYIHAL